MSKPRERPCRNHGVGKELQKGTEGKIGKFKQQKENECK